MRNSINKLWIYFKEGRPETYIMIGSTTLLGMIYSHDYDILTLIATILNICGINLYNHYEDYEIDMKNNLNRALQRGDVTKQELYHTSITLLVGTPLLVSNYRLRFILMIIGSILGIAYSHKRIRLKKIFPLNYLTIATYYGGLSFLIGVGDIVMDNTTTQLVLFFVAFDFFGSMFKDFRDYEGDKDAGIHTLPTIMGIKLASIVNSVAFGAIYFILNSNTYVKYFAITGYYVALTNMVLTMSKKQLWGSAAANNIRILYVFIRIIIAYKMLVI